MGRAPCCDKASVKRGPWSPEEDAVLRSYIHKHGTGGNWITLPQKAGLKRCGKSCRLRWLNYLRPDIKHGGFTQDEDNTIFSLYRSIGSRWSVIASQLPGRTDNDVKNYWNTKLKKKFMAANTPSPPLHLIPPTNNYTDYSTPSTQLLPSGHGYATEPHRLFWELAQLPPLSLVEMPSITGYMDSGSAASSSTTTVDNSNNNYANWCVNGIGSGGAEDWFLSEVSGFGPPAGEASMWDAPETKPRGLTYS